MVTKNEIIDLSNEKLCADGIPVATQAELDELIGGHINFNSTALKFSPRVGSSYKVIWGNCTGTLQCVMKGKGSNMVTGKPFVKFYFELTEGKITK